MTTTRLDLVSIDEIRAAALLIECLARRTPLIDAGVVAGRRLYLKCENMQPSGAFKIRGAANMLQQLTTEQRRAGVITYSSGNHGRAVAAAASALGAPAVVVMPTTAPAIKVEGVRREGAEVVFDGTTSTERRTRAEAEAAARGLTMVPPFDHPWIIAGQGTVGLEIAEALPDVAGILVPVGGGGLISGIGAAVKQLRPSVRIVGVEPTGANAMQQAVKAGAPVTIGQCKSVADGLLPVRAGDLTFAHVEAFVDGVVTVDDDAIIDAMRWLYFAARLVVEPSGATATAALLSGSAGSLLPEEGPIVAVLSGGNVAPATLASLLENGNRTAGSRT
jgi:threonine dehydratase